MVELANSKRERAGDPNLSRAAVRVRHNNMDASPAVQDEGRIYRPRSVLKDVPRCLDLPMRQSGAPSEIAVDLVCDLAKLSAVLDEECSFPPEVLDGFSCERGHLTFPSECPEKPRAGGQNAFPRIHSSTSLFACTSERP
jgi:hypothetical protein